MPCRPNKAMRLPAFAKKKPRIEIIPMIDTMFFLLVFFMIATLAMTIQHGMPVSLPTAESSTDKIVEHVSLTLTREATQGQLRHMWGLKQTHASRTSAGAEVKA